MAIVLAIVIVASVVVYFGTQARASFVGITKGGASGNSMFFNVTIRTSGVAIEAEKLQVDVQSVRSGATFDEIVYYNLERIPGGTLFIWNLDISIDPLDEPSFTYVFTLEVNGSRTDSSTVT